jgi:hypothetical protein
MSLRIAFHSNQLSITGTEVALYDYALHNENVLGNRSVVIYPANSPHSHQQAEEKFRQRFELLSYRTHVEMDALLLQHGVDLLYAIKSGKRDGLLSKTVPTMVHAVFPTDPAHIHGAAYAYISEWLSRHCARGKVPCVPHMVELPDVQGDLRQELGIPGHALVLGCHGGRNSFNVLCAVQAMTYFLEQDRPVYFLFLNIAPFVSHPRAIFLEGTTDLARKTRFINTCSAMLHARLQGESFGLACGEFSIRNKPVLSYAHTKHTHHHDVLGAAGLLYTSKESLIERIESLNGLNLSAPTWDRYTSRYNKERVMELFERHLIHPALHNPGRLRPQIQITLADRLAYFRLKLNMRAKADR